MKIRTELNNNETISIGFGRQYKIFLAEHVGIAVRNDKIFILERVDKRWSCLDWHSYLKYINELDAVIKKVKKECC